MSNNSSEPYDLLDFNNQATRTGFQERLLNAHNASRDQQIENNIVKKKAFFIRRYN